MCLVLVVAARGLEGPHSSELTWNPKERDRKRVREGSGSPRRGKGFVGTMLITLPLLAARESQLLLGGGAACQGSSCHSQKAHLQTGSQRR